MGDPKESAGESARPQSSEAETGRCAEGAEIPPQPDRVDDGRWDRGVVAHDTLEFLWRSRNDQEAAIRFADTKVSLALLVASTATGWAAVAVGGAGRLVEPARLIVVLLLIGTFASFLATLAFTVLTIRPNRAGDLLEGDRDLVRSTRGVLHDMGLPFPAARGDQPRDASAGLIYFGDVASYPNADAYIRDLADVDAGELARQLGRDVWRSALLCARKYAWVRGSVYWSACTALGAMLTLLALALGGGRG
jgi:hypothetical protein